MTFSEWMTEIALDGIGGAIVGGLVTALAVVWTLRHERRMTEEAELRAKVSTASALAMRALRTLGRFRNVPDSMDDEVWADLVFDVAQEVLELATMSFKTDPDLRRHLLTFESAWDPDANIDADIAMIRRLVALLHTWRSDPGEFHQLGSVEWPSIPTPAGEGEPDSPSQP